MANTKGIRAGKAYVELGVSDKLSAGLRKAQKRLKAFGEGLRSIGTRVAAVASAALAPLLGSVKAFSDTGDVFEKMARRTGVSVEALSELGFAAEQSGTNLETLEKSLRIMQKTVGGVGDESESADKKLKAVGLTFEQLRGLSPERQFTLIAEKISQIADPSARAAAALRVFGRSGAALLPLMEGGARGINELREQARALGLTISTETAKDAALLHDTLNILWRVLKQGVFTIGSALAPTIIEMSNAVTRTVVRVTEWIRQNKALVVTALKVAAAVAAGGVALIALGWVITGVAAAVGGLASIVAGVGTAFGVIGSTVAAILSPIGLVISAAVALGGTLLVVTDAGAEALSWLGDRFRSLKNTVFKVIEGISDALAAGDLGLAAGIAWLGIKLAWQKGIDAINQVWQPAKAALLETWYDFAYGVVRGLNWAWYQVEKGWIATVSFLSRTWANFTKDLQMVWAVSQNWLTKQWLKLMGLFDETLDVDAAIRMADEDLVDTLRDIEDKRAGALADIEKQRTERRQDAEKEYTATRDWLLKEQEAKEKKAFDDAAASVAQSEKELADARSKLADALAKARQKREEAEAEPGAPRRKLADPLADLEDRLAGLGKTIESKISVTGTFNPAALWGLGGGSVVERTARASEQTAKNTKRLVDAARTGGLTFG